MNCGKKNPMSKERFLKQIEFIKEIDKLKNVFRQTRILDNSREENDAEHGWHLAMMAFILEEHANELNLNMLKIIKMVLIHDIVEIDAGDTFLYASNRNDEEIFQNECKAAERIFGLLPEDQKEECIALWKEYEAKESKEAQFAAALDRLEPILQNCETGGHAWKKHKVKYSSVLERNRHTAEGSLIIWEYIQELAKKACDDGILEKD